MPGNTSWIPSIIIWAVAFIWFVATMVYYFRRRRIIKTNVPKEEGRPKPAIGGLIGESKGGRVTNSFFKGKITIKGKSQGEVDVGSLIGKAEDTKVNGSSANAEIEYKED